MEIKEELVEEFGKYYIINIMKYPAIQYEILISMTKESPYLMLGKWVYLCSLWDLSGTRKICKFPIFANSRKKCLDKILKNYKEIIKIHAPRSIIDALNQETKSVK